MMAENYKIYESEVNSEGNLKIKQKSVFLSNINVKDKIISYEDLIVFGDIKAKYLLVSGNLVVLGNINVKEVDIEGSLIHSENYKIPNINVDGQTILIDKHKDAEEDKSKNFEKYININEINIDNLNKNTKFLSDINNLKNRIIDEICDNEPKYYLENIYSIFTKLENTFIEFKQYSDFIGLLLLKYRSKSRCDMNLINYLKVINYKLELPSWLLKISYIEEILKWIDKLKINNMTINLENESEVNEIKYFTYKCKDELGDKFDEIFFMLEEEDLEEISLEELQQEANITSEKLYEKYIQKKDNYDLIEGTIKSIEQNRIILYIEDQVEVVLKDYFDIGDKSFYKVGDKLGVYVLSVFNEEGKLDIEVYRNSEKCMYENISKLDMSSLSNLKLNDIEIVNNEELFITNYIGKKEEIESIESIIKNKLLLKKVIILDPLDLKIENIAKIFNVSKETIIEEARNEYIINVFNIENYTKINKLANKYKELLKSININSVKANKISIKTKYNLYHKKMDKLIEGKIKGINNNEYIIDIEPYVKARLKYVNANKKYNINDKVIAKIEVLSLDEQSIYLSVCNNYKKYVQDLLEYKIKEYKIKDMVNKIEVDENNNEIYNVKLLLNKIYDRDLIYKIKNEIEDKIDKSKVSLTILEFNDNNNDNLSTISSELNKNKVSNNNLISTEQIIKLFNKKKRECGVPEIRVIKTSRVNGYKTVILSSNLTLRNSKDNLLSLQYDMESELKGEKIKIVVFDKDVTKIIADMIEIEKKDVEINHTISSVKIYIDQKIYNNINEASEKVLLSGILPYTTYYKIDFIIKDKNLNERNIVLEEDQKQNNVDDDILGLLFK